MTPYKVEKPWGHEIVWAKTKDYVGKILFILTGHKLSLQYHKVKEETIHLESGLMDLEYEVSPGTMKTIRLVAGDTYHIEPKRKHRMVAVLDCRVYEVSTPHLEDVVRIQDSYGRAAEAPPVKVTPPPVAKEAPAAKVTVSPPVAKEVKPVLAAPSDPKASPKK
jgi:mannose-6-phosphate isomerase-like protein (cupin superfamily)